MLHRLAHENKRIRIITVQFHGARHPRRWRSRVRVGTTQQPISSHESFPLEFDFPSELQVKRAEFVQDLLGRFTDMDF